MARLMHILYLKGTVPAKHHAYTQNNMVCVCVPLTGFPMCKHTSMFKRNQLADLLYDWTVKGYRQRSSIFQCPAGQTHPFVDPGNAPVTEVENEGPRLG